MNVYLINWIIVFFMGLFSHIETMTISIFNKEINVSKLLLAVIFFFIIFFEMGLRGDFCIDTLNYEFIYRLNPFADSCVNWKISNPSIMYFLIWAVNFFSGDYLIFLCITAAIMGFCYAKFIFQESELFWLSVLVFLCSGSFYTGFNVMRQFWAAACFACCIRYVYKRQFWKYLICVLLISQIHFSSVFLIPIYFILNKKWTGFQMLIFGGIAFLLFIFADVVFALVTRIAYMGYGHEDHFGVNEAVGFLGTIKAVAISSVVFFNYKYFDLNDNRERLIFNGVLLYLFFALCGARVFIIQRFIHFFIPCIMLAYPIVINRIQKNREIKMVPIVLLLLLTSLNIVLEPNYYFYWENQIRHW